MKKYYYDIMYLKNNYKNEIYIIETQSGVSNQRLLTKKSIIELPNMNGEGDNKNGRQASERKALQLRMLMKIFNQNKIT